MKIYIKKTTFAFYAWLFSVCLLAQSDKSFKLPCSLPAGQLLQTNEKDADYSLALTCVVENVLQENRVFYFKTVASSDCYTTAVYGPVVICTDGNDDGIGIGYQFSANAKPKGDSVDVDISANWTLKGASGNIHVIFSLKNFENKTDEVAGLAYTATWIKMAKSMPAKNLDYLYFDRLVLNAQQSRLNSLVAEIKLLYSDDKAFLAALEKSQEKWIAYCDSMITMRYPANDPIVEYGSGYRLGAILAKTDLIKARIRELSAWMEGTEEGVVGAGSVKRKEELADMRAKGRTPNGN